MDKIRATFSGKAVEREVEQPAMEARNAFSMTRTVNTMSEQRANNRDTVGEKRLILLG